MSFDRHTAIFEKSKAKLSTSSKIKAFLDTNFPEGSIHLYDGIIPELQPESSNYPIIAFSAVERDEKGDAVGEDKYICAVSVAILYQREEEDGSFFDETVIEDTVTTPRTVVVELPGKQKVQEFWSLVRAEILSIKGLYAKISAAGDTALEEAYPIFKFSGSFSFSFKRNMRSGSRS